MRGVYACELVCVGIVAVLGTTPKFDGGRVMIGLVRRPTLLLAACGLQRSLATLTSVSLQPRPSQPEAIPGYIGGPKGSPAVIVIQEWWGVDDGIKAKAEKIASEGYRVFVPDIYKGKIGVDAEEAHHLMSNLDFPKAVTEISEVAAHLKEEGSPAVGVVGFCMGGALTMGALAASKDITCGAPFYGVNFGLFETSQLKDKPVQGHFGEEDTMEGFSDVVAAKKLEGELKAAGNANAEVFIYDGVGHAFMNTSPAPFKSFDERKEKMGFPPYDELRARLAWNRLFEFFGKHLKGEGKQEL